MATPRHIKCYNCEGPNLPLAPLTPDEAVAYPIMSWVMRQCTACGYYQNHNRGDHRTNRETLDPFDAAEQAPRIDPETGLITVRPKLHTAAAPTEAVRAERARIVAEAEVEIVHGGLL